MFGAAVTNQKENVMRTASDQEVRHSEPCQPHHVLVALVEPVAGELALHETEQLRLRDAFGWSVKVVSGTVWITQESDSRDIVLKAGEVFVLDRLGSALVSSLGDARICLKQEFKSDAQTHGPKSKFLPAFSAARALFA